MLVHSFVTRPRAVMAILCICNLLNYIDRGAISGIIPVLDAEFGDTKTFDGILGASFMICYVIFSVIFVLFAEVINCFSLLSFGMIVWIIAAVCASFSGSAGSLLFARVLSGAAEASLQVVAPTLIKEIAPNGSSSIYLSLFLLTMNCGLAMGNAFAGLAKENWRWLFAAEAITMIPPLIAFIICAFKYKSDEHRTFCPSRQTSDRIKHVFCNINWWLICFGYSATVFSSGSLFFWLPSFVNERFHLSLDKGDGIIGAVIVIAGIFGTLTGGFIHRWIGRKIPLIEFDQNKLSAHAIIALQASSVYFSVAFAIMMIAFWLTHTFEAFITMFGCGIFVVFCSATPITIAILDSVHIDSQPHSMAFSIVLAHLIGDVPSPIISGKLWDDTGEAIYPMTLLVAWPLIAVVLWIAVIIKENKRRKVSLLNDVY